MKNLSLEDKRKLRRKQTAEVFTPALLVNNMLDKLPDTQWEEGKTFCDPACGNGNMLIEVLRRKLKNGHVPSKALSSIYGVDIMDDNIAECRQRLLSLVEESGHKITAEMRKIVRKNIVCTPLSKYPRGSLDYDFEFNGRE